jgi:nitroimidazol reductase NimA-like FMN-containing flavoprotein (pyridoxamine 5'-phosphate oxidase superfamily)
VARREQGRSEGADGAHIDPHACLALLGAGGIGRVGVSIGAVPAVFPVHYAMLDGEVVFRTAGGTMLDAAVRNAVVAFEVDDLDPQYREGWSVLVVGIAGEIADDARRARAEALPLRPWDPGSTERVMVIRPELVSGRRIMPQAQRPWESEMGAPARP